MFQANMFYVRDRTAREATLFVAVIQDRFQFKCTILITIFDLNNSLKWEIFVETTYLYRTSFKIFWIAHDRTIVYFPGKSILKNMIAFENDHWWRWSFVKKYIFWRSYRQQTITRESQTVTVNDRIKFDDRKLSQNDRLCKNVLALKIENLSKAVP